MSCCVQTATARGIQPKSLTDAEEAMTTQQWPPKRERKEGDYMKCDKCGGRLEVLFQVAKCPCCDRKPDEEQRTDVWQEQWKTLRGLI